MFIKHDIFCIINNKGYIYTKGFSKKTKKYLTIIGKAVAQTKAQGCLINQQLISLFKLMVAKLYYFTHLLLDIKMFIFISTGIRIYKRLLENNFAYAYT